MRSPAMLTLFCLFFTFGETLVSPELVFESGYSISSVVNFNKPVPSIGVDGATVYPFTILPLAHSPNLLLLDSTHSSFYSLEIPLSQESELRLISGKGMGGFSDGGSAYAMFNHPRSFAVDSNDNVYVADRMNHAIRKISSSGMTTTIAGNNSSKPGHADGPGQNATFSEDFDLVYMPKMCALLISDRGNRMIRQVNLKPEDCIEKTQSSKGLGVIHVSIVAVLCLLCGLAMGFFARPYMMPPPRSSEASSSRFSLHYWNHLRPTARIRIPTLASGVRNVVVSFKFLFLLLLRLVSLGARYLHAVFGNTRSLVDEAPEGKEAALLLDPDSSKKLQVAVANHENSMKDLLDLTVANVHVEVDDAWEGEQQKEGNLDMKIANMMKVNLVEFTGKSSRQGVIRRKPI